MGKIQNLEYIKFCILKDSISFPQNKLFVAARKKKKQLFKDSFMS